MKREDLIAQIQNIEGQFQSYVINDQGKSAADLEGMSTPDLQDWLNLRSTRLQATIDAGIEAVRKDCTVSP